MGSKCCCSLNDEAIVQRPPTGAPEAIVHRPPMQALSGECAEHETGFPISSRSLPKACCCSVLSGSPDEKATMHTYKAGQPVPIDPVSDDTDLVPKAFCAEHLAAAGLHIHAEEKPEIEADQTSLDTRQEIEHHIEVGRRGGMPDVEADPFETKADKERRQESKRLIEAPLPDPISINIEVGRRGVMPDVEADPFETMTEEERRQESKRLIKAFVTTMVKGTPIEAVAPTGETRTCYLSLNRELDTLKLRAREAKDAPARSIVLQSIDEILVGTDTSCSKVCLKTPLDDRCVTLVLDSDDCVTFRLANLESRDTLAACLSIFCNEAKNKAI